MRHSLVLSPGAPERFFAQRRIPSMPGEGSIRQVREFGVSLDQSLKDAWAVQAGSAEGSASGVRL